MACPRKNIETSKDAGQTKSVYNGDNYKIGVILPLTGRQALYGENTLHGIECAVGIFTPCEGAIRAELVIKDDAGLPDRAALAVEELVKDDKVSIIIGPMTSSSIESAARKAQEMQVPLISLSQKEGIANIGDFIFSVALTSTSQVGEIVKWAVNTKKIKNFGVVYPLNEYGEIYKNLFTSAVKKIGGKIAFTEGYGEATLDFGSIFRNQAAKYDAVFIPDSYRAVGYLASTIMLEGLAGVQLLGINRWNNPELVDRGGDALENAVFVDGFFENSKSYAVQKFSGMFNESYHIAPTVLEAQAFDAGRLAAKAVQSTGGAHGIDVRNALATTPEVEGATGDVSFDSNREAIKKLFLMAVKNGKIVELEGGAPAKPKGKYGEPAEDHPAHNPNAKY